MSSISQSSSPILRDGTKVTYLSEEAFHKIHEVLQDFRQHTKCPVIMLSDLSGSLIAQCGHKKLHASGFTALSAVAAASYAATNQMAKLIGESNGFKAQYYEGETLNIHITPVSEEHLLVAVFKKELEFQHIALQIAKTSQELRPHFSIGS